jgi:hypothetical protein
MCWLKRDIWKAGIVLASVLFLLILMVWLPASSFGASKRASGFAEPGTATVQTPSTADLTITAVVQDQLKQQDEKAQRDNSFPWTILNAIGGPMLAALAAIAIAFFGLYQWRGNRDADRQKEVNAQNKELRDRAEERFQTAVAALGDDHEGTQVCGAILLRSFLHEEDKEIYGRYYTLVFDLAVAYLRFPIISDPRKDPVRQALITVFKEAFPLARNKLIADGADREGVGALPSLDASRIQLDHASLREVDLKRIWMPQASLQKAILYRADLTEARLKLTDLTGTGESLLDALSLKKTDLREVKGLTKEELEACKAKGAIIDDEDTPAPPTEPPQNNNISTPSAPPVQVNTPAPNTDAQR